MRSIVCRSVQFRLRPHVDLVTGDEGTSAIVLDFEGDPTCLAGCGGAPHLGHRQRA